MQSYRLALAVIVLGACAHAGERTAATIDVPARITGAIDPSSCVGVLHVVGQIAVSDVWLARGGSDLAPTPFAIDVDDPSIAGAAASVELVSENGSVLAGPVSLADCASGLARFDVTTSIPVDVPNAAAPRCRAPLTARALSLRFVAPDRPTIDRPIAATQLRSRALPTRAACADRR